MMPRFKKPFERLTNVDEVRLIQVIQVKSLVGSGDGDGSPCRQITEYFNTDGGLLARRDKYLEPELDFGVWDNEDDESDNDVHPTQKTKKAPNTN